MKPWILLRGLMRESRHWESLPAKLADTLPGADIVVPDLPGAGRRHREPSPLRIAAITDAVREDLRDEGIAPPGYLLALSLGAMVAVDWACRYRDEVAGIVLINTSLRGMHPLYRRLRPSALGVAARIAMSADVVERERLILELTSRDGALADRLQARVDWQRERPMAPRNAWRQLFAAARFAAAEKPPVPTLLLAGAGDALVDPECSRQLARRWGAPISVHPTAGHDLPLDDPDWVAAQVGRWSRGQG